MGFQFCNRHGFRYGIRHGFRYGDSNGNELPSLRFS